VESGPRRSGSAPVLVRKAYLTPTCRPRDTEGVTYRRLIVALLCAGITPGFSQVALISHFSSPSYPPLARQAGIGGQVTLSVRVTAEGSVAAVSEALDRDVPMERRGATGGHPLLVEEAKRCIATWTFSGSTRERRVIVTIYFGFTGAPVDSNPKTTVTADFAESAVRVYVTTNPAPMVRP
jgi:TonB family protein